MSGLQYFLFCFIDVVQFSTTTKGRKCLIYLSNMYYVNHIKQTKTFWVCTQYYKTTKCNARCVTDFHGNIIRATGNHNHLPYSGNIYKNSWYNVPNQRV